MVTVMPRVLFTALLAVFCLGLTGCPEWGRAMSPDQTMQYNTVLELPKKVLPESDFVLTAIKVGTDQGYLMTAQKPTSVLLERLQTPEDFRLALYGNHLVGPRLDITLKNGKTVELFSQMTGNYDRSNMSDLQKRVNAYLEALKTALSSNSMAKVSP